MTAVLVGIGIAVVVVVWVTYLFAIDKGYDDGHAHGFAAGQLHEREALGRIIDQARQRGLAAERNIEYLYERARWEVTHASPAPSQPDRDE